MRIELKMDVRWSATAPALRREYCSYPLTIADIPLLLRTVGALFGRARAYLIATALVAALVLPADLRAQDEFQEELEFYLMNIQTQEFLLAESVMTYQSGEAFLVDFTAFLEGIEFQIDRQGRLWSGWFRDEERRFSWETDAGEHKGE